MNEQGQDPTKFPTDPAAPVPASNQTAAAPGKFAYAAFDGVAQEKQAIVTQKVESLDHFVKNQVATSREQAVALTKLEEFHMWWGKAVKADQNWRNKENAQ